MTLAVVTVVAGRHDRLMMQRSALAAGVRVPDLHVVVAMGDPAVAELLDSSDTVPTRVVEVEVDDGRLPLAAARNAGAREAARRGADALVLLDVDVVPARELVRAYGCGLAQTPDAVLSGAVAYLPAGVVDPAQFAAHPFHPARPALPAGRTQEMTDVDLFWSLSFALAASTWTRVGGFDEAYTGYGAEDTDFARRAAAAGVPLRWLGGAEGFHLHHPVSSPPVEHLDDILRNGARFAARFGEWPMAGWLRAFEDRGLIRRDGDGWTRT